MSTNTSNAVLSVIESSTLTDGERKVTFQDAVKVADQAFVEGYREVIENAHKVGLTAGKSRAKKDLLGKLRSATAEDILAMAYGQK